MRILYCNWVDYLDPEARGGGVTVYQRNLMAHWRNDPSIEAGFLSAGTSYDLLRRAPRWEAIRHGPPSPEKRYEIINSGCLAPSHFSFGDPAQLCHPATTAVFQDFLKSTGPWDIVHFNNLEGFPLEVLSLRAAFPQTRFVLSLHNYYPVCPQVNLWYREKETCPDFDAGRKCTDCLVLPMPDRRILRAAAGLAYHLKCAGLTPGTPAFDLTFRQVMRAGRVSVRLLGRLRRRRAIATAIDGAPFADRRAAMIAAINAHCDKVLCVSDRVRDIAAAHGIDHDRLVTEYIGSAEASRFPQTRPADSLLAPDGTLHLAYLGYMRADKGFFFLLDALEALPAESLARLRLTVAARRGPADTMDRIAALRPRMAGLTHVDGYRHDDLDALLADVRLGLVPVLWEDNLPQVAIEMHARHIALLTADRGGARELGRYPDLVHQAGSVGSFGACIERALAGGVDLDRYWQGARAPVPVEDHAEALKRIYRSL